MDLLRDLWRVSPRRTLTVALLVVLAAGGAVTAAAVGGQVLVERSTGLYIVLSIALAIAVVAELTMRLTIAGLSSTWAQQMRARLNRVALTQELDALEESPVGELLDRIDDDTHQVGAALREVGLRFTMGVATAVLGIVAAAVVWLPAGVGFAAVAALFAVLVVPRGKKISEARVAEEEKWSDLAAVLEEAVHGQDDIRTSLAQPYILQAYAQQGAEVLATGRKVWRLSGELAGNCILVMRLLLLVISLGGLFLVSRGELGLDRLTSVWLLAVAFGFNVEALARWFPDIQEALGSWTRIRVLLDAPQEPTGGRAVPAGGAVEVRDLTFRYGEKVALEDVSLTFQPGTSYALVGRSGSGKSTLAKILTRAVPVPPGRVTIGGEDVTGLDLQMLRTQVAMVTQRTELLAGTLRENIALYDPELLEKAEEAVEALGLGEWVAGFPAGLETVIGERGVRLSAGEEQLVAFARVLVRDPQVVILDEATARMDPVTEVRVEQATNRLVRGRIGIVIAHRLSTVERCDEVIVLDGGRVLEAGPRSTSERFAALLEAAGEGRERREAALTRHRTRVEAPPALPVPEARPVWNILRLLSHEKRYGVTMMLFFGAATFFALDGVVLAYLWGRIVEDGGTSLTLTILFGLSLFVAVPGNYLALRYFPEWWVHQILRLRTRILVGQTGPVRRSGRTPAEVVAVANDTDRVVDLADNVLDLGLGLVLVVAASVAAGSVVPGLLLASGLVLSALTAHAARGVLRERAEETIEARNDFAAALGSVLNGAATVKLAGATQAALRRLDELDAVRSERTTREVRARTWATSAPTLAAGLLPIAAWGMYLGGILGAPGVLVAVGSLDALRWFGWVVANLVASMPSGRVWMGKAVELSGSTYASERVPGVDHATGTAPGPEPVGRTPLEVLQLERFTAVHEDGTVGVEDVDLTLRRGELVLVTGMIGAGKSSLLRAVAGIVHHEGHLYWNGVEVEAPEEFLRPAQVSYVAQRPRVVSGSFSENVTVGHPYDVTAALESAQLGADVHAAGGATTRIGHRGTRLSGGQLQRLALARALAPGTELVVADDISSALDVHTELAVWRELRNRGVSVLGSTFKRAALEQADKVVVLEDGKVRAVGRWEELEDEWGHLAG